MIRTGEISDIDAILNITKSCALHMIQNNIINGMSIIPTEALLLMTQKIRNYMFMS